MSDSSHKTYVRAYSKDFLIIHTLRRMLRVSWTAKKTDEWVLNKAGVKRELLDTVKARKLA